VTGYLIFCEPCDALVHVLPLLGIARRTLLSTTPEPSTTCTICATMICTDIPPSRKESLMPPKKETAALEEAEDLLTNLQELNRYSAEDQEAIARVKDLIGTVLDKGD
jgi:hypothetical protein